MRNRCKWPDAPYKGPPIMGVTVIALCNVRNTVKSSATPFVGYFGGCKMRWHRWAGHLTDERWYGMVRAQAVAYWELWRPSQISYDLMSLIRPVKRPKSDRRRDAFFEQLEKRIAKRKSK